MRKGCENLIVAPATDGGKEAASPGWIVTGEAKIGSDGDTALRISRTPMAVTAWSSAPLPARKHCAAAQSRFPTFTR